MLTLITEDCYVRRGGRQPIADPVDIDRIGSSKLELAKPVTVLQRNTPDMGTVSTEVKLTGDPYQGGMHHEFFWPLTGPKGSWKTVAASSSTGTPPTITTLGTRRIDDPVIELAAVGELEVTGPDGVTYKIEGEAGPDYPVTIDVGARTVIDDSAADARGEVVFSHRAWLRLWPSTAHTVTSDVACTVTWHNRWS